MNPVWEDALRATLRFIGQSVEFLVGLAGVIMVTGLSLSGEVVDEFTTYANQGPFPWGHVTKVMLPPTAVAVAAYMRHRQMMTQARNEDSEETIFLRKELRRMRDISGIHSNDWKPEEKSK